MSKIKILHIIKTLNLGGAETNLLNLLQAADKQRYEMHIGYSFGGELEKGFIQAQARLFKYSKRSHRIKSVASVVIIARIWWYLLINKIDIVHTHNFNGHIWGAMAAKLAGKKIVEHVHDFRYSEAEDFTRRRGVNNQFQFIRFFKNVSDRVIVLTRHNVDFLLRHKYYSADKIVELQNGIPLTSLVVNAVERTRITARLGIRSDAQIILTPARIASEKNLDLIFRIAALIKKAHPRVMFVIAGDGPLFKEYQEYIKGRHAATYIELIGFYADIRQLLAVSDVFLLPSFLELHSIAILEAMSMKVPVVVSRDVGCNSEFIDDGKNGILCDPFVDSGWADALGRLLANQEYRQSVGQAGYQTCVEKFDINKTVKNIEGIYEHFASS